MDICISSNFERFLYHMAGEDAAELKRMMEQFEATGALPASDALLARARAEMKSARVDEAGILATIKRVHDDKSYVLDPHSAIGVAAAEALLAPAAAAAAASESSSSSSSSSAAAAAAAAASAETSGDALRLPVVCLACAHWGKFPKAVSDAIGASSFGALQHPVELTSLDGLPTRVANLPNSKDAIKAFIRRELAPAWVTALLEEQKAAAEADKRAALAALKEKLTAELAGGKPGGGASGGGGGGGLVTLAAVAGAVALTMLVMRGKN